MNRNEMKGSAIDTAGFFNSLYGKLPAGNFVSICTAHAKGGFFKPDSFFETGNPDALKKMAQRAQELNAKGCHTWHNVNCLGIKPENGKRGTEKDVSYQTAIVADIDIKSAAHKEDNLVESVEEALATLPLKPTFILYTGYGIQPYWLFDTPIAITNDNRAVCKKRNEDFLKVIAAKANGKKIDGVANLDRILRTLGTKNYKLGIENAPTCHIIEVNDVTYTPEQIDSFLADFDFQSFKRLNVLITKWQMFNKAKGEKDKTGARRASLIKYVDDPNLEDFRVRRMLDFINPAALSYDDWLAVGMALKNAGFDCNLWTLWSRADERFKEGECEYKWGTFNGAGYTIGTIYRLAEQFGYNEKNIRREYSKLHPERKEHVMDDFTTDIDFVDDSDADSDSDVDRADSNSDSDPNSDYDIAATADDIYKKILDKLIWNKDRKKRPTKPKDCISNYEIIFHEDPNLIGLFGFDDFRLEIVFKKRAPWHDPNAPIKEAWEDSDDSELRLYLAKHYAEFGTKQRILDFIVHIAHENHSHSIKQFLEGLPDWDGVNRMDSIFIKFLGADDTAYTREVTKHLLLGAIARALYPGCDFQETVVLQGAQGIGKSRLLRMLGGKDKVNPKGESWHVALRDQLDDSHAVDAMRKGWFIELEEFAATSRTDVNAMKGVLSADDFTRRFAYDRRAKTIKAHWVFVGTTNDDSPLRDQTGNRRFLPIKCHNQQSCIVEGMTANYIQQVWAEAYRAFKEMFPTADDFDADKLRLPRDIQQVAVAKAEAITQDDGLTTEIKGFLNQKILPDYLWHLLTKEQRRDFIKTGYLKMEDAVTYFNHKRRARGGKADVVQADVDKITNFLEGIAGKNYVMRETKEFKGESVDVYTVYGSEYRKHICAAEIFNEAFGADSRKRMIRISEVLSRLKGWEAGDRLQKADPCYPDQSKPYYRIEE